MAESTALEEWIISDQTTRATRGDSPTHPEIGDIIERLTAILGYDVNSILGLRTDESTTAAIRKDLIWNRRLTASFAAAKEGRTRRIEEYWAESDAEDG